MTGVRGLFQVLKNGLDGLVIKGRPVEGSVRIRIPTVLSVVNDVLRRGSSDEFGLDIVSRGPFTGADHDHRL
jgi:hypothetical protein